MSPTFQEVFVLGAGCTAAFGLLAILQLARRLLAGATPGELWRQGFHECPPIQALLLGMVGVFWMTLLLSGWIGLKSAFLAIEHYQKAGSVEIGSVLWVVGMLASVGLSYRLQKSLWNHLRAAPHPPVAVQVEVSTIESGIADRWFQTLGAESFPNQLSRFWKAGLWIRRLMLSGLALGLLYLLAMVAWEGFELHKDPTFAPWPIARMVQLTVPLEDVRSALTAVVRPGGLILLGLVSAVLLVTFLAENRQYLLLRFASHWLALGFSGMGLSLSLLGLCGTVGAGFACGVVGIGMIRRLAQDLSIARRYAQRKAFESPMAEQIRSRSSFLSALTRHPECEFPKIDKGELSHRISRGAKNLEEAGALVTRNFGRYLRLARVEHRRCAMAALRYLTVSRRPVFTRGWPTSKALYHPQVPVWDLSRFPLNPPDGYRSLQQQMELHSDWNATVICGQCNGSGTITVTETYQEAETRYETEYSGGQSRMVSRTVYVTKTRNVTRTCPTCNGSGRMEYVQGIHTEWRQMQCRVSDPTFPMPELADGAEEVVFFDMPYTESFRDAPTDAHASWVPRELEKPIAQAGRDLRPVSGSNTANVLKELNGQYVFRSGFAVYGFHTIRIRFGRLLGRCGWFFGRRPEFHFPRLPLSWGMLATRVLILPTALWLGYCAVQACGQLLGAL